MEVADAYRGLAILAKHSRAACSLKTPPIPNVFDTRPADPGVVLSGGGLGSPIRIATDWKVRAARV